MFVRTSRKAGAALGAMCCVALYGMTAAAHPLIDEGLRLYAQADFEGSLQAFALAESTTSLTRDDLVQLLAARAVVHYAMGAQGELQADLSALASIQPGYLFAADAPPELQAAFDQARQRSNSVLRLTAEVVRGTKGVRINAHLQGDGRLVRTVRIFARHRGEATYRSTDVDSLEIPTEATAGLEYYVQANGPGGAVLAAVGSATTPERWVAAYAVETGPLTPGVIDLSAARLQSGPEDSSTRGRGATWLWVGVGAVAVTAAVVLVVVLTTSASSFTQPSAPTVQ